MSLAIYAAPFDEEINDNNIINKKRQTHNKTQKRYNKEEFNTEKVNNVLQSIHDNSNADEQDNMLGNFEPPPKPQSVGVEKTITTEQFNNKNPHGNHHNPTLQTMGKAPEPNKEYNEELELNNFNTNYGDNKSAEEYYKKFVPHYQGNPHLRNPTNRPYYTNTQNNAIFNESSENSQDLLLQKLNYMINLLEEKQDEKTNNVTEEIVLYSFLGIFIIFIVDSFARIGKYVR